ncbi:MAG: hypothetical protein LIP01_10520 [Tannerellaceae bacterium]|nr:hypothetical protein [Tannerellaceae bacterium]
MEPNKVIYHFWIDVCYRKLADSLKANNLYNEDVFHDTLLEIYSNLPEQVEISVSKCTSLFVQLYRKKFLQNISKESRYVKFETPILELIVSGSSPEEEENNGEAEADILPHLKKVANRVLSPDEYRLFNTYVAYPTVSIRKLSLYIGIPCSILTKQISKIKETIRNNYPITINI